MTLNSSAIIIAQERILVIIDADTGNEVDDLYALSRALIESIWNILALNATHWAIPETMENSHRLNQMLDNGRKTRIIWDLALVQAMIHPDLKLLS